MTEIFGIVQTGKRAIPGLKVEYRGNESTTYQSNETRSLLFGQGLYTRPPDYVYLDADGSGLQFTGSTARVTSFTVGIYVYAPRSNDMLWGEVVVHQYSPQPLDWPDFRIMPSLSANKSKVVTISSDITVLYKNSISIPAAKVFGWVHITHTYEQTTGVLTTYFDGEFAAQTIIDPWEAHGTSGAYAHNLDIITSHC